MSWRTSAGTLVSLCLAAAGVMLHPSVASAAPYLGAIKTLPGSLPFATSISYDANSNDFFVLSNDVGAVNLFRVTPHGKADLVASGFDTNDANVAYSPATHLVYVVDPVHEEILEVDPHDGAVTFLCGGSFGEDDGQGGEAQFSYPSGITVDPSTGMIFVGDDDRIREITPGGDVTTLTAPGLMGGSFGFGLGLTFATAQDVVVVADPAQDVIRQVTLSGSVSTIAGSCYQQTFCFDAQRDGPYATALFASPAGVTYDAQSGAIFVADTDNNQIRELLNGNVTTLTGNGRPVAVDGFGTTAALDAPDAIAYDPLAGSLFITDQSAALLRTVAATGSRPPPLRHGVILYDPPSAGSAPQGIAATADDSIWFSEFEFSQIGRRFASGSFAEYPLPSGFTSPTAMTLGADGDVWFANRRRTPQAVVRPAIGKIDASGAITEYVLPIGVNVRQNSAIANYVTVGPDGDVWFLLDDGSLYRIARSGPPRKMAQTDAVYIAAGYDGALWATTADGVDRYSNDGMLLSSRTYSGFSPGFLREGPHRHMWIAQPESMDFVKDGELVDLLLPRCTCGSHQVVGFTVGDDDALYLAESGIGYIGRLQPSGYYEHVIIPTPRTRPTFMTTAPDGSVWFVDPGSGKIGRWF